MIGILKFWERHDDIVYMVTEYDEHLHFYQNYRFLEEKVCIDLKDLYKRLKNIYYIEECKGFYSELKNILNDYLKNILIDSDFEDFILRILIKYL